MSDWIKTMDELVASAGLRYTFSINCHSGIVSFVKPDHKCGCKRCRQERGEPWDEQTEAQAKADSEFAQKALRQDVKDFFDKKGKYAK